MTWEEAPEWRRIEAQQYNAEERANLRSWGVLILDPPPDPLDFAVNLDKIARGELRVVEPCDICAGRGSVHSAEVTTQHYEHMTARNLAKLDDIQRKLDTHELSEMFGVKVIG
jgi:hypothetical protein